MRNLINIVMGLLLLAAPACVSAADKDGGFDIRRGFSSVAKKAIPAVVFVQVEKTIKVPEGNGMPFSNAPSDLFGEDFMERFFGGRLPNRQAPRGRGGMQPFLQMGQGSGFIISKDGYILTNTHVIDEADKIRVRLNTGKEYLARRIGADARTEVAVIKIDAQDLPTVEIGDVTKLETGDWVVAIGNPFGLKETVTVGVVSAKGRSNLGLADYEDFIQTDAAINPGNSGGPLLNIDGQVVGMNTAIFSRSGGYMGIGFALPIDMAIGVKNQLVKSGKVTRGYIGVALNPGDVDDDMAASLGLKLAGGALIADVVEKGPADQAGLKSGDVVVAVDGRKIADSRALRNDIARLAPGTRAELTVMRNGDTRKMPIAIGAFPEDGAPAATGAAEPAPDLPGKLGLQVENLTPDLAQRFGYTTKHGVIVTDVHSGSPAERAGIQPGNLIESVNRKEVPNVERFEQAARKTGNGKVLLQVRSPEGVRFVLLAADE